MKWTTEEESTLKIHYENSDRNLILSLLPNRSWDGIMIHGRHLGLNRDINYKKDETFFETPNLNNCWASGFISGDGFLVDSGGYKNIGIELNFRDVDILEKIKELTGYTGNIRFRNRKFNIKSNRNSVEKLYSGESKMAALYIYSANKYHEDLFKNWNLIPNKVKRLEPPNITDLRLVLAFISGNICADGNINYSYIKNKNETSFNITFLGTSQFLEWIKSETDKIMKDPLESSIRKERLGATACSYKIGSIKSYLISKMILSLDIYHMKRKWDKAQNFINMVENLEVSTRFLGRLQRAITPEIINFVKGTPQEFSPDFLKKIGYLP